jgi:hypothetical protein
MPGKLPEDEDGEYLPGKTEIAFTPVIGGMEKCQTDRLLRG